MSKFITTKEAEDRYRELGLWGDQTFYDIFREKAERLQDKKAIVDAKRTYTYKELMELVDNLAGHLIDIGLRHGDVVGCQFPNWGELALMHLALNRMGVLFMPIHDGWREAEVGHLLKKSNARMVIVPHSYRGFDYPAMVASMRNDLPDLSLVYSIGGATEESLPFEELLEPSGKSDAEIDAFRPDTNLPGAIMVSSGTTALPKISLLSTNNLMSLIKYFIEAIKLEENDISAAIAPAGTGATGYVFPILGLLLTGGTTCILEHWNDPKEALDLIIDNKCTYATAIPTQMTMMIPFLANTKPEDFSAFTCFSNAGAPLPYKTGKAIEEMMGCKVQVMYGATEAGAPYMVSVDDPQEKRLLTVGHLLNDCDVELWDADEKKVPEGSIGEVVWRTAMNSYGYLNDDEETAKIFTEDGFYKSGDLGKVDEDGYLQIVGRVKDMILRGGRNICPKTSEEILIGHPSVAQVAVAVMPDPRLGERACAFVVLNPGQSLTFDEMIQFLKEKKTAVWELPERLEIIEEMPISAGAKIMKNKLTDIVSAKLKNEGKI